MLQQNYGIPLILLSMGKEGSAAYCGDRKVVVPGFINPHTVETTGAGDTFCACVLNYVLEHRKAISEKTEEGSCSVSVSIDFSEEELREMLRFANAAASIITTRKGALKVMPEREEILQLLAD